MYMHLNLLSCCLEPCCLLLLHFLGSNSIWGNQLTSLWQHFGTTLNNNICVVSVSICVRFLAYVLALSVHQERWKEKYIHVSAVLSVCVVLWQGGQARPVHSSSGQRNRKERDWRAKTEFQAPHWAWNFKNFQRPAITVRQAIWIFWAYPGGSVDFSNGYSLLRFVTCHSYLFTYFFYSFTFSFILEFSCLPEWILAVIDDVVWKFEKTFMWLAESP